MTKANKKKTMKTRGIRMIAIRKMKSEAKKKGKKPSSIRKNVFELKADQFMNKVLARKEIDDFCPHFLIGSSSAFTFLQGKHTFRRAHSFIETSMDAKFIGALGEEAFKQKNQNIMEMHPFTIGVQNPWFCATPDFLVVTNGEKKMVEVKTYSDPVATAAFFSNVPLRTVIQVWLGFELLGLREGIIQMYISDKIARRVTLYGCIHLKRTATLFSQQFWQISCFRYVEFLKEYLENHDITPSEDYFDTIFLRLISRFNLDAFKEAETSDQSLPYTLHRPLRMTCHIFETTVVSKGKEENERLPYKNFSKISNSLTHRN